MRRSQTSPSKTAPRSPVLQLGSGGYRKTFDAVMRNLVIAGEAGATASRGVEESSSKGGVAQDCRLPRHRHPRLPDDRRGDRVGHRARHKVPQLLEQVQRILATDFD